MRDFDRKFYLAALKGGVATALLGTAALSLPASAQEQQDQEAKTEEIIITGSRIARTDLTAPSPVAVVDSLEFQLSGTVNVEEVLNSLPQVIPGTTAFSNNPGGGVATVDLRNLGPTRTLVLVNGRRYIFFDASQIVDLNNIPAALIDRVETVTGGASAVYGSDAVSGVVNFILKDDFEGIELNTQYDITSRGDADRFNTDLTFGGNFADGRGNAVVYANYLKRDPVFQAARKFSEFACTDSTSTGTTCGGVTGLAKGGSGSVLGTRLTVPAATRPTGFPGGAGVKFDASGNFSPFAVPGDLFNYAPDNFLQVPQERWILGGMSSYRIADSIEAYTEITFTNNRVDNELAPTPFTQGSILIDVDSPFLSAASRAAFAQVDAAETGAAQNDGFATVGIGRRLEEVGSRQNLDERNAWRFVGGLRGDLDKFAQGWSYDVYYMFARTRNSNIQQGNVSRSRVNQALKTVFDSNGNLVCSDRSNGCVPLNIFGPGNISPAAADFIRISASNGEISQLQVASGTITGTVAELPAGPLGFAGGAEWRSVSASFLPDTALSSGDVVGFNAGNPTNGGYNVWEVFGEVNVPILADLPMVERMEFTGAIRYSDYSLDAVGGVFTWAAGLDYAPIPDITFRGQFQRAVRAPNVQELFGGQSQGFPGAVDPCSDRSPANQNATVAALCVATGVPAASVFTSGIQVNSQIEGLFGGNPDLQEETSNTYTIGAIITPTVLPNFSLTVDYYNVEVNDFITVLGGSLNNVLNLCYNVIQDVNSPFCQAINRNADGTIGGTNVVSVLNANIANIRTAGIDVEARYSFDLDFGLLSDASRLDLRFLGTYVRKNDFTPVAELPNDVNICADQFGPTCGEPDPKFRWVARSTWSDGPLTLSLRWRYLNGVQDDQIVNNGLAPASLVVPNVGSQNYFDLSGSYDVNENLQLYAGVNNLFDNKPPILGFSQEQSNTYPGTYDTLGTRLFFGARARF